MPYMDLYVDKERQWLANPSVAQTRDSRTYRFGVVVKARTPRDPGAITPGSPLGHPRVGERRLGAYLGVHRL